MIVAYSTSDLRRITTSKEACEATHGLAVAEDIIASMAELAAAESMEELLVTMIWQVIDKVRGEAIMRGPSGVEIQVVENHARPCDVRQGNIVDWSFVRRVKITSIQVKS